MKPAVEASATALANAARSPILPVPNEKDGSLSRRRNAIGESGDEHHPGVGRHVQAVSDERHGAEQRAGEQLDDHGQGTDDEHRCGSPRMMIVPLAQKIMPDESGARVVTGSGA